MNIEKVREILSKIDNNVLSVDDGVEQIKDFYYKDLGYAKVDYHREGRVGYPEVIYAEGKTPEQIVGIIENMNSNETNILATRVSEEVSNILLDKFSNSNYNKSARTIVIENKKIEETDSFIGIVTAGTSDLPIAEEALETAKIFGNKVKLFTDVGVAGIHRLFDNLPEIRKAKVLIVVAGMEGALPSVVGGLVSCPIIAVPTSIGYGANFEGLSALLSMLNSCSAGISVVNIDNGFGAAYQASMINKL